MTTKTRADLINAALANLGLLAAGQSASAEDFNAVDDHIDGLIASLDKRDIVTVDNADAIPIEWFNALSTLLADQAASEFGMPGLLPSPSAQNPVLAAETELREIVYARPTREPMRGEYY
jgi:hypothetical protein